MPEQWERAVAAGIHLISIPAPLWGPLIAGFVMKSRSRFAEVHAWKALKEYIILSAALLVWGIGSLIYTITRLVHHFQTNWAEFSWWEVALRIGLSWGILFLLGIITAILSIGQAIKAFQGSWPKSEIKKSQKTIPPAPSQPGL
jgi:hypothetical protein